MKTMRTLVYKKLRFMFNNSLACTVRSYKIVLLRELEFKFVLASCTRHHVGGSCSGSCCACTYSHIAIVI